MTPVATPAAVAPTAPFIVFEGLDGAGTTTQAHRLVAALAASGCAAQFTCEPSTGPVGTMIRQALTGRLRLPEGGRLTPATLALLFAADRCDHLAAEVQPLRHAGVTVVCDRYLLSSLAYQGQELPAGFVVDANAQAVRPDLTLFLRVSPETALQRRASRHGAEELYEAHETQRRVARAYEEAIRQQGEQQRVCVIDGEQPLEAVTAACLAAVQALPWFQRAD